MGTPRAKILVIDDEQGIRELLKSELGRREYIVDTANNGEEGVEKIKQERYDIVISDIKMPTMDGLQALEAIKRVSPETEVIMITGYATVENAVLAMKEGAYDFIQKPFNLEELAALIEKALEKSELKTLLALYESSKAIFSILKLEELFPVMINLVKNVLKADEVALLLLDNQNQLYLAAASFSLVYNPYMRDFVTLGERIFASDKTQDQPVILHAPLSSDNLASGLFQNSEVRTVATYPLKLKNRGFGFLMAARTRNSEFTVADIRNLSIFVSQITQAIANSKLYEKLEIKVSELESARRKLEQIRKQLVASEKFSAVSHIVAGIVDQMKQPLQDVTEQAKKAAGASGLPATAGESLAQVSAAVERCNQTIGKLAVLSTYSMPEWEEADLNRVVEETVELLAYDFQNDRIGIEWDLHFDLPKVRLDVKQIKQLLLNLLSNAQQSFSGPNGAREHRTLHLRTYVERGRACLEVKDNGFGIAAESSVRVFEPFFTTKDPKQHLGLGLNISKAIVQKHNGTIDVKSTPNAGTAITVSLPLA